MFVKSYVDMEFLWKFNTDQGRNFDSKLIKEMSQLFGIQKTRATPLHPQPNGQVERQNRTILEYLSKYITNNQQDWDRWVSLYLLAYRSSVHATTGVTPAEMYTGTEAWGFHLIWYADVLL